MINKCKIICMKDLLNNYRLFINNKYFPIFNFNKKKNYDYAPITSINYKSQLKIYSIYKKLGKANL